MKIDGGVGVKVDIFLRDILNWVIHSLMFYIHKINNVSDNTLKFGHDISLMCIHDMHKVFVNIIWLLANMAKN